MILFAGVPSEPPLALAIASAERLGLPHRVFNQRHVQHADLATGWRGGQPWGRLATVDGEMALETAAGLYLRAVDPAAIPELRPHPRRAGDPTALARAQAVTELLYEWTAVAPGRIANRPQAMGANGSKPYQAQAIRAAGLKVPATLITNDPAELAAFCAAHGRIIYKSTSGIRSIVKEWRPDTGPDPERLRRLPTQFQAFVPGQNVRVHIVGDGPGAAVFAHRIVSDAVDYRYAGDDDLDTDLEPMDLPDPIAAACRRAATGLALAGIDLKITPDGDCYCFEVNPCPAYSYYQQATGQMISDALVRWLAGG